MFTKKVKYVDFDGNLREETVRFNLNESEVLDLQMSENGGLTAMIERMIETQDNAKLAAEFRRLLALSYGEKSLDGRSFVKEDEEGRPLFRKFKQTGAYNEVYKWLLTGENAVLEFMEGIIPKEQKGNDRNLVALEKAKAAAKERFEVIDTPSAE